MGINCHHLHANYYLLWGVHCSTFKFTLVMPISKAQTSTADLLSNLEEESFIEANSSDDSYKTSDLCSDMSLSEMEQWRQIFGVNEGESLWFALRDHLKKAV